MTTYSVNINQLAEIAGEMGQIAGNIQANLEELDSASLQNLSEWTSAARDAYNVAKAKWNSAAQGMVTQAKNAQASLAAIGSNYQQAERVGTSLWD
jgi:WXG100 family type VII secretion target